MTYYKNLKSETSLNTKSGTAIVVSQEFYLLSALLVSRCSYIQSAIQNIIFKSHGLKIDEAKVALLDAPSPKARLQLLQSFTYENDDHIITKAFAYAQTQFTDIYNLRNILAHETWMTSEFHPNSVLFSKMAKQAQLQHSKEKFKKTDELNSKDIYNSILRYIRSVKVVSTEDLQQALADADRCAWIMMQIGFILEELDEVQKSEMKRAFLVFKGTNHLFDKKEISKNNVNVKRMNKKSINH